MKASIIDYHGVRALWDAEFPMLKKFTRSSIMLKADIMLLGIVFSHDMFDYGVELRIIPLWQEQEPNIDSGYYSKLRYRTASSFNYRAHVWQYPRLIEQAHGLWDKLFKDTVSIHDIAELIRHDFFYSRANLQSQYFFMLMCEILLAMALYLDDAELTETIKKGIEREAGAWGIKIRELHEDLYSLFSDRDKFMAQVRANSQLPKVAKLNNVSLVAAAAAELDLSRPREYFRIGKYRFRKWWKE